MTEETWVPLEGESLEDYLDGHLIPLEVRETEHCVEVLMPHDFPETWQVHRICRRCGLLPLDYDAIEYPCEERGTSDDE